MYAKRVNAIQGVEVPQPVDQRFNGHLVKDELKSPHSMALPVAKPLSSKQRRGLALWAVASVPFVGMGLLCGCGTLMDNQAPPVAKQVLQGVDVAGSGVAAVVWSPSWIPKLIRSENPDDLYGMAWTGGPVATSLFEAKLRRRGKLAHHVPDPAPSPAPPWLDKGAKKAGEERAEAKKPKSPPQ